MEIIEIHRDFLSPISKIVNVPEDKLYLESNLVNTNEKDTGANYWLCIKVEYVNPPIRIAQWTLTPMPGCCGILISTNSYVNYPYRKLGLGTILNKYRIQQATEKGYGLLFCTDKDTNIPQKNILAKNGWELINNFTNPRTGNLVNLHVYNLIK